MKKEIIILLITLLILPTIIAETPETNQEFPNMEPATKSINAGLSCYSSKFNVIKSNIFQGTIGLIFLLAIIDLVLKGFAMWRAVKKDHKIWFIIFLIFNTLGILPLIYLIITRKKK